MRQNRAPFRLHSHFVVFIWKKERIYFPHVFTLLPSKDGAREEILGDKICQSANIERSKENCYGPHLSGRLAQNSTKLSKNMTSKSGMRGQCIAIFKNSSADGGGSVNFWGVRLEFLEPP